MAGTIQAIQAVSDAGIVPNNIAASIAATNEIPNANARAFLVITTNATAGGVTLTFKDQTTVDGQAGPDRVVVVAASTTQIIGLFPVGVYDLPDNNVQMNVNTPANIATAYLFTS